MKFLLLAVCLLAANLSFPQIYRAGETTPAGSYSRWEVAAGWNASTGEVALKQGSTSSDGAHGFYGRALYSFWRSFSIGAEGSLFFSQSLAPVVDKYKATRAGVLLKYLATPNTNPRVYLLAGAGATFHQFHFKPAYRGPDHTRRIAYLAAGAGIEINVWENVFAALEGRVLYNTQRNLNFYYGLSKQWESEGKLLIGLHF